MKRLVVLLSTITVTITAFAIIAVAIVTQNYHNAQLNLTAVVSGNAPVQTAYAQTVTAIAFPTTTAKLDPHFLPQIVNLSPISAGAGTGKLTLNVILPTGYAMNDQAPFTLHLYSDQVLSVNDKDNDLSIITPAMPVTMPITLKAGQTSLTMDSRVYYCESVNESRCYPARIRFVVPLTVTGDSKPDVTVSYTMQVPTS